MVNNTNTMKGTSGANKPIGPSYSFVPENLLSQAQLDTLVVQGGAKGVNFGKTYL